MGPNMIELHYLSDNSPVSINVNLITHFFEYKCTPLRYESENKIVSEGAEIIRGTRICFCGESVFNVAESYEEIKNKINVLKNKVYIENHII